MARRKAAPTGMKCQCGPQSFVWLAIGAIVVGIGFWSIIKGFMMQNAGVGIVTAVLWYAIGVFVLCFGKGFKRKACPHCYSK